MADFNTSPKQNQYKTQIVGELLESTTVPFVLTVKKAVGFTLSAGEKLYVVLEPNTVNEEGLLVNDIDGNDLTIETRGLPTYEGGPSTVRSHGGGSTIIISDNWQTFDDIKDAVNSKFNKSGGVIIGFVEVQGPFKVTGASSYVGFPPMTTAQRLALAAFNGIEVYDTDLGLPYKYIAGSWTSVDTGIATPNAADNIAGKLDVANATEMQNLINIDAVSGAINAITVSRAAILSTGAPDAYKAVLSNAQGKIDKSWLDSETGEPITTGENVTAGNALRLKIDGKVYKTVNDPMIGAFEVLFNGSKTNYKMCYVADDAAIFTYIDGADKVVAVAGTYIGNAPTFGTPTVLDDCSSGALDITKVNTNLAGVVYRDTADSNKGKITMCSLAGLTVVNGTPVVFEAGNMADAQNDFQIISPAADLGVVVWCDDVTNNELRARAFTGGFAPIFGAEVDMSTVANSGDNFSCCVSDTNKFTAFYGGTASDLYARANTIAGNTITTGTEVELHDGITISDKGQNSMAAAQVDTDKFAVTYINTANSKEYLTIGTIAVTVITGGTPVEIGVNHASSRSLFLEKFETNKLLLWYYPNTFYSSSTGRSVPGTIAWVTTSGTVPTVNDIVNLATLPAPNAGFGISRWTGDLKRASANTYLVSLMDPTNFYITAAVFADNNFIGFAESTVLLGQDVAVNFVEDDNQVGLTKGSPYYLNATGGIALTGNAPAGLAISTTKILK